MVVNRLIGMCNPIAPPKTLAKNRNSTPIPNLTVLWAMKRIGFAGAPTISSKTINATMMVITTVELKSFTPSPSPCPFLLIYERKRRKRTVNYNELH